MSAAFAERPVAADGAALRCLEAGAGALVLALGAAEGAAPTGLERLLAQTCRVVLLRGAELAARPPQEAARLVARAAQGLGLGRHALLAGGAAAAAGVACALAAPGAVEALVLAAPGAALGADAARLGEITAPTLVLAGTRETPAAVAAARRAAERVRDGYFMLVYDAGAEMQDERPAALVEAVADFIERRGRFVLERQASALSP